MTFIDRFLGKFGYSRSEPEPTGQAEEVRKALQSHIFHASEITKDIRSFDQPGDKTSDEGMPLSPQWYHIAPYGWPRGANIPEIRKYAKYGWVRIVINTILLRMRCTPWYIGVRDEDDDNDQYKEDIERATAFLNTPNRNGGDFWSVWGPFMRDVLEIDAGVVYKGFGGQGDERSLREIFSFDGSRFLFSVDKHKIIHGFYQYSVAHPTSKPLFFPKEQIIYGQEFPSNELFPYGYSPIMCILQEIEAMIQSTRWNKELFRNHATPDGIVTTHMDKDEHERFKNMWQKEMKGKPHKLAFINASDVKFEQLSSNAKDMEWLNGQEWYMHAVFAAYNLSPQEVGFYKNSSRATGESQERVVDKNAVQPRLEFLKEVIDRHILVPLLGHDKLCIKYDYQDSAAQKAEHEQLMDMLDRGAITINEYRAMKGLLPLPEDPEPQEQQQTQGDEDRDTERDDRQEERDQQQARGSKARQTTAQKQPKPDPIEKDDAKGYADFLEGEIRGWEKKVLQFLDEELAPELDKKPADMLQKSFGSFLRRMLNEINTLGFAQKLRRAISVTFKEGIEEAEKEVELDIGMRAPFEGQIEAQVQRQLDGFLMQNGKRWNGLKGMTKEVQDEITRIVSDGVAERRGIKEIKGEIKGLMRQYRGGEVEGEVTDGRAMRIARTETNRIHNEAKVASYKESGLRGRKKWVAFEDSKTSEVCSHLHQQEVGLYDNFTDSKGNEYSAPPAHPNCRSVVEFVFEEE